MSTYNNSNKDGSDLNTQKTAQNQKDMTADPKKIASVRIIKHLNANYYDLNSDYYHLNDSFSCLRVPATQQLL
jgi:hypothetical protein